jgi:hypothetical protein
MKCKDSNKGTDNTEHLTLNEILKMFDEKLEKFFKQEKSKDMNNLVDQQKPHIHLQRRKPDLKFEDGEIEHVSLILGYLARLRSHLLR